MLHGKGGRVSNKKLRIKVQQKIICLSAKPYTGLMEDIIWYKKANAHETRDSMSLISYARLSWCRGLRPVYFSENSLKVCAAA